MRNRGTRITGFAAAPLLAIAGMLAGGAPSAASDGVSALATEYNEAVLGGPIQNTYGCTESAYGEACFVKYGDQIYLVAQSTGVYARWSNWLWDGSSWRQYRQGECSISTQNTWGHCNKDFYEDSTNPNAFGGKGSGIRLSLCKSGAGCSTETWTWNDG